MFDEQKIKQQHTDIRYSIVVNIIFLILILGFWFYEKNNGFFENVAHNLFQKLV